MDGGGVKTSYWEAEGLQEILNGTYNTGGRRGDGGGVRKNGN